MSRNFANRVAQALDKRDGGVRRCVYCGRDGLRPGNRCLDEDPADERLTIDHVIPKALGGPNHIANKVISCERCNSAKASSPLHSTGMTIRWGIYASDNPQESLAKVWLALAAQRVRH